MTPSDKRILLFAVIILMVAVLVSMLPGCAVGRASGMWPELPKQPPKIDPLTSPIAYVTSLLRTVAQWALIIGVLIALSPRLRAILWPPIMFLLTAPKKLVAADWPGMKRGVVNVALAAPRAVGLVREDPKESYRRIQRQGIEDGWIDGQSGWMIPDTDSKGAA